MIYLIGLKIQTIIHHDQNEEGFVFFIDSLNLGMESEMRYNKLCVADEWRREGSKELLRILIILQLA